jgi:hypothetical protein
LNIGQFVAIRCVRTIAVERLVPASSGRDDFAASVATVIDYEKSNCSILQSEGACSLSVIFWPQL